MSSWTKRYIETIFDCTIFGNNGQSGDQVDEKQNTIRCDMTQDMLQALTRNPDFLKDYKGLMEKGPIFNR